MLGPDNSRSLYAPVRNILSLAAKSKKAKKKEQKKQRKGAKKEQRRSKEGIFDICVSF